MAFAVGMALAERQLWGKAARLLEESAGDATLPSPARRQAWLTLARIAAGQDDTERAAKAYEAAATLA
jgi:HemY protein